jgi:sugar/nucleoside kinase (ribokinase family)
MVKDLDAVYVNFISGFELCLGTAQALRQGFQGPIYADLHSLFLGMQQDGIRVLRPLPNAPSWFGCFDFVQLNEDEMHQLTADPLILAAEAMGVGVSLLTVTLGPRGAAYVAAPGFDGLTGGGAGGQAVRRAVGLGSPVPLSDPAGPSDRPTARPPDPPTVRTALVAAPQVDALDPTGCGDVFGAAVFARLLAGDSVEPALRHAANLAARNAAFRGASGLSRYLRGELVSL